MAVNAIALLILMAGVIHLGQYQSSLIAARLQTFERETDLIAVTFSEILRADNGNIYIPMDKTKEIIERLKMDGSKILYVFDAKGDLLFSAQSIRKETPEKRFDAFAILKDMASLILKILPEDQTFPRYKPPQSMHAWDFPNVPLALEGKTDLSVWSSEESRILLSAAKPLIKDNKNAGALLITWQGYELEEDIARVWINVLKTFLITLGLTVLISIYLSGVIAQPLKKLARATEAVRKGQATAEDIPDFTKRMDEIGELSIALKQMTKALSNRMDSIERFAADVAHELKNPLTSLRSAFETLGRIKKKSDKDKLIEIINHDINRMDRLISDIAYASRLDTALSREQFKKTSLRTLLHNALKPYGDPLQRTDRNDKWSFETRKNDIKILLEASNEKDVYVWGIENRLMQVFENILSNAISFAPKNGTISVFVKPDKNTVSIFFENQGPPIPKGKEEAIFERFYSQRPDYEEYGQHSGLGLSICKQIIDAHKGQIFAENIKNAPNPDKTNKAPLTTSGVRFTVVLNI